MKRIIQHKRKTFRKVKVNQYATKRTNISGGLATCGILLSLIFIFMSRESTDIVTGYVSSKDVFAVDSTPTPTPTVTLTVTPEPTISVDIKQYIKTIFGKDARTACAIARSESGYRPDAQNVSTIENSRGIFQINLESKYAKVHYDRVPGNNLDEKIEWLEDPYNSTLMAYWIYTKSGFNPWSVFTNGNYKQFLEECK